MSKNRMVNTKFWTDRFVFELSFKHKLVFLYLLTNDATNISGVYELNLVKASIETGIELKELDKIIKELEPKAYYFEKEEYVYLPNFLDHQGNNPNINLGVIQTIKGLPTSVIKKIESLGIGSQRLLKAFKGFQRLSYNSNFNSNFNSNKDNKDIIVEVPKNIRPEIDKIYKYYITKFGNNPNQYKLTNNRRLKIKARLSDAGEAMLLKAIDNTANSKWHRGDNDRGWQADLDFIIRSYEQVEKLSNMADTQKTEDFNILGGRK